MFMMNIKILAALLILLTGLDSMASENKDWSFIVISDIHIRASGEIPPKVHKTIAHVVSKKPDIVFITGDHTSGNVNDRYSRRKIAKWYDLLDQALEPLYRAGIHVIPTVGNHDFYEKKHKKAYTKWATKALSKSKQQLGITSDNPLFFNFSYKEQEFFIMKFWRSVFDSEQQLWFKTETKEKPKHYRFAYGHIPLKSIRGSGSRSFYRDTTDLFTKAELEIYFSGHEHMHWDQELVSNSNLSLRQVTTGTASGTYNHPISQELLDLHCTDDQTCLMPFSKRPFSITSRSGKQGYQVHRENFTEVIFSDADTYQVKSYAMDKNFNLINFYNDSL